MPCWNAASATSDAPPSSMRAMRFEKQVGHRGVRLRQRSAGNLLGGNIALLERVAGHKRQVRAARERLGKRRLARTWPAGDEDQPRQALRFTVQSGIAPPGSIQRSRNASPSESSAMMRTARRTARTNSGSSPRLPLRASGHIARARGVHAHRPAPSRRARASAERFGSRAVGTRDRTARRTRASAQIPRAGCASSPPPRTAPPLRETGTRRPCPSSSGWQHAAPQSAPQSLSIGVRSPMQLRAQQDDRRIHGTS